MILSDVPFLKHSFYYKSCLFKTTQTRQTCQDLTFLRTQGTSESLAETHRSIFTKPPNVAHIPYALFVQ